MKCNKERHLKLLKCLLGSKKLNKNFYKDNPEDYRELIKYEIILFDHIFWTHQKHFIQLIENFINTNIDFEKFEIAFSLLYRKTNKEFNKFRVDLKQIEKFKFNRLSYEFGSFMAAIFRTFEEIEDEYSTEEEAKDFIKVVYLRFQNIENT